jgi:hypothetical protein
VWGAGAGVENGVQALSAAETVRALLRRFEAASADAYPLLFASRKVAAPLVEDSGVQDGEPLSLACQESRFAESAAQRLAVLQLWLDTTERLLRPSRELHEAWLADERDGPFRYGGAGQAPASAEAELTPVMDDASTDGGQEGPPGDPDRPPAGKKPYPLSYDLGGRLHRVGIREVATRVLAATNSSWLVPAGGPSRGSRQLSLLEDARTLRGGRPGEDWGRSASPRTEAAHKGPDAPWQAVPAAAVPDLLRAMRLPQLHHALQGLCSCADCKAAPGAPIPTVAGALAAQALKASSLPPPPRKRGGAPAPRRAHSP